MNKTITILNGKMSLASEVKLKFDLDDDEVFFDMVGTKTKDYENPENEFTLDNIVKEVEKDDE